MKTWTLITGAAKGFGASLALSLAKKGHSLLIHYNHSYNEAVKLQQDCLKYSDEVKIFSANFLNLEEIIAFTEKIKNYPIKYLINNVGNYLIESALNTEIDDWVNIFQTNLHAPFILSKKLSHHLITHQGAIINMGVAGVNSFKADVYSSAYTISKKALYALTQSLAKELLNQKVRVNMVSPGHMENSIDLHENVANQMISFEEVTRLIIYLLNDENRNITGQNIEIAAGIRL